MAELQRAVTGPPQNIIWYPSGVACAREQGLRRKDRFRRPPVARDPQPGLKMRNPVEVGVLNRSQIICFLYNNSLCIGMEITRTRVLLLTSLETKYVLLLLIQHIYS